MKVGVNRKIITLTQNRDGNQRIPLKIVRLYYKRVKDTKELRAPQKVLRQGYPLE